MIPHNIFIVLCFIHTIVGLEDGPIIDISSGSIQGKVVATHYDINVNSFYGIPFGAPPVGDLRFEVLNS